METVNIGIVFLVVIIFFMFQQTQLHRTNHMIENTHIQNNEPSFVKPEHKLYYLLHKISNGDKINLEGDCEINLYTQYTLPAQLKSKVTNLINHVFEKLHMISSTLYFVQDVNHVYEQIDAYGNKRYISDVTLHAMQGYYSVKLIVDIVLYNNEVYVNYIHVNTSSYNNVINRYDRVTATNQAVLDYVDTFSDNIRNILDDHYSGTYKVVGVSPSSKDSDYSIENVLSLNSLLKLYLPSTTSASTSEELKTKGLNGYIEMYLPPDISDVQSPSFCNKNTNNWDTVSAKLDGSDKSNENCVADMQQTTTEFNQPWQGPGLFYSRSSQTY